MRRFMRNLALISVAGVAACNPFESKMTTACEEVIKQRLVSPSSYKRIKMWEEQRAVPLDEYEASELAAIQAIAASAPERAQTRKNYLVINLRAMREKGTTPIEFTKLIGYDAANSFGALLRKASRCTFFSESADESQAATYNVVVDGKTEDQWRYELYRSTLQESN